MIGIANQNKKNGRVNALLSNLSLADLIDRENNERDNG